MALELNMVEFFSGIGGMRCAVEEALRDQQQHQHQHQHQHQEKELVQGGGTSRPSESSHLASAPNNHRRIFLSSCHAFDISLDANAVYRHNFHDAGDAACSPVGTGGNSEQGASSLQCPSFSSSNYPFFSIKTKLVEQLRMEYLQKIMSSRTCSDCPCSSATTRDLWTLSPPCQPFTNTRHAKRKDAEDRRCNGLRSLLGLLCQMDDDQRPFWIFLENVKGFVGSQMQSVLKDHLQRCGYSWKEVLMSPTDIGVPNHRMRYYILCERSDRFFARDFMRDSAEVAKAGAHDVNGGDDAFRTDSFREDITEELLRHNRPLTVTGQETITRGISGFLIDDDALGLPTLNELYLPDTVLERDWAKEIPIVTRRDRHSHCFTAFYARQIHKATGSILLVDEPILPPQAQASSSEEPASDATKNNTTNMSSMMLDRSDMTKYAGKLRRFAPEELLNLFGFPRWFSFPPGLRTSHKFKLIGNSISVFVVKELLRELIFGADVCLTSTANTAPAVKINKPT